MASVSDILKEIKNVQGIIDAKRSMHGGDTTELQKSYAQSLASQISLMGYVSSSDGRLIMDALSSSPVGVSTDKVISALEAKLRVGNADRQSTKKVAQNLHKWWAYFTQSDWDFIRDPRKQLSAKMTRLVERAHVLGVTEASEQTLKWMLATLLVAHYAELPSAKIIYDKLQELKEVNDCEKKRYPLEFMKDFPDSPDNLPKHVYDYAYTPSDPPITVELHGINTVAAKIPLRSNSLLLRDATSNVPESCDDWKRVKRETIGSTSNGITVSTSGQCLKNGLQPVKLESNNDGHESDLQRHRAHHRSTIEVEAPQTPEEEALLADYRASIWKLRARKQGTLASPCSPTVKDEIACTSPIVADSRAPAGLPQLSHGGESPFQPRQITIGTPLATKAEHAPVPTDASKAEPESDDSDLDPCAKAAIAALQNRAAKKKISASVAKKKVKSSDDAPPRRRLKRKLSKLSVQFGHLLKL